MVYGIFSPCWIRRMFRKLDTRKALQAIGVALRTTHTQSMGRLRILKLLYIAEREMLQETGRAMLGCRVVAMDHGPLHSVILDLLRGGHSDVALFNEHFQRYGVSVELRTPDNLGVTELSRFEVAKIVEVCTRFEDTDDWDLAHGITHGFEEWKKRYEPGTSRTILLQDILEAVGRSEDKTAIERDEQERAFFAEAFRPEVHA